MKKLVSLGIMVLLIVGMIQLVLAETKVEARARAGVNAEIDDTEADADTSAEVDAESNKETTRTRGEIRANVKENRQMLRTRLLEVRSTAKAENERLRTEFKNRIAAERAEIKSRLQECKDLRLSVAAKTNAVDAATQSRLDVCAKFKEDTKKDIVAKIKHRVEAWISQLEKLKVRVEESDLGNKAEIVAEIDAEIKSMNDITADLNEDSSNEEVRAAIKELKQIWASSKARARMAIVLDNKMQGIIQRGQNLEAKLEDQTDRLEARGYDTSDAAIELQAFRDHLQASADARAEAEAEVSAGNVVEARALLQKAREELQAAQQALQEYKQSIKEVSIKSELEAQAAAGVSE